jgi:hypothetical protein
VGDEHDRSALLLEGEDAAEALPLERLVADGEDLVEEEDVGVEECRDREAEAHGHPGRVRPHRAVDRVLELGERDDLVEAPADLGARKTLDRAVQEDVLAPCEIQVEAGTELEQRPDPALRTDTAGGGLDDPGDQAQKRGLPRSVPADETDCIAAADLDGDVAERPDVRRLGLATLDEEILERPRLPRVDAEAARDAFHRDLADFHAT